MCTNGCIEKIDIKKGVEIMQLMEQEFVKTEKVDGVIFNMSPSGGFAHSQINGNIYHAIKRQLKDSVCVVSIENLDLYLSEDEYVIPDIMLICDRQRIKNDKYRGVPRFIAETLSPRTALRDRTIKLEKYAKLGVDEYWIVLPKERCVEIYYLEGDRYELKQSYILVEDEKDENYNADKMLALRAMPSVTIGLKEMFDI